jgi:hypothetical protein
MDLSKVHFPLPWREGMKGRGREFLTFYDIVNFRLSTIENYRRKKCD